MGKVVYSWDDRRLNAFQDSPLHLAAIAGPNSFYYTVADSGLIPGAVKGFHTHKQYHFFDRPLGYLEDLVARDTLLCADFSSVKIALRGVPFILMPSSDFNIPNASGLLSEVTDISPADMVLKESVNEEIALVFAIPEIMVQSAWSWFSGAQIGHAMASMIKFALTKAAFSGVLINTSEELAEIVITIAGALRFANHYRISAPQDVLYYVSAILEELETDRESISVRCCGQETAEVTRIMRSGFADCEAITFPDIPADDFPGIESTDLMSVLRCGS